MNQSENKFRVIPLSREAARRHRLAEALESGGSLPRNDDNRHQCRSCLGLTLPGEDCLLFSHSPFPRSQPYAESGPIFIHRRECTPYAATGEFPAAFRRLDLVLRAYGETDEIVDAARAGDRPVETVIAEQFGNPAVAYLHVRNTAYGCYICRIERA